MNTLQARQNSILLIFKSYYFCLFFAIGSLGPLLSSYFKHVLDLSTSQIGILMSLTPIIAIFSQPLWGMVSDITQNPKKMLLISQIMTIIIALFYSTITSFGMLLFVVILLSMTQSALIPLSDSIALNYVQKIGGNYGAIRLYGSIGFALAVLFSGRLAEMFGLTIIFFVFAFCILIGLGISIFIPKSSTINKREPILKGIPILFSNKRFMLFLIFVFLVFGPISANNTYFGLYIQSLGGTLTGVGIAFLISAGSEAPFLQVSKKLIQRFGVYNILIATALVSALRWYFYFTNPPLFILFLTCLTQGLSVGLFIPAALQFVREQAPDSLKATAVTIYSGLGLGVGEWFCTFIGGFLSEAYTIKSIYILFGSLSLVAVGIMQYLKKDSNINDKKEIA
ncbi:MFS transporter [Gottfriedia luciferensis]|uniref:MFS transporter n=1 Tax=Gottfriedia luciferensis TaxID=178774 RepID=UPI0013021D72|nr:MFS transporter [Gottfriedia luciferensis]